MFKRIKDWFRNYGSNDDIGVWFHVYRRDGRLCLDVSDHSLDCENHEAAEFISHMFRIGGEINIKKA